MFEQYLLLIVLVIAEQLRACFLLLLAATLATADLPVDCRYQDAVGVWYLKEGARTADQSEACTALGKVSQDQSEACTAVGEVSQDQSEPYTTLGEVSSPAPRTNQRLYLCGRGESGPIRALHRCGRGEGDHTADQSELCSALGEVSQNQS